MGTLKLPTSRGGLEAYVLRGEALAVPAARRPFNRIPFPAAHVVAYALSAKEPSLGPSIDWTGEGTFTGKRK